MQEAATGLPEHRDIDVAPIAEGILTQYGIAMMAIVQNGILAVGIVGPDLIRQKFKLRCLRPVMDACGMAMVGALYFLQEHQVYIRRTQLFPHAMQYESAVTAAEALVYVVGENA
jgi:hypothetical protein